MSSNIDNENFEFISSMIKNRSGIVISEDKKFLVESRLRPVMRRRSIESFTELSNKIRENRDSNFVQELIEAMTINESLFFRDIKPFHELSNNIIPSILEVNPNKSHIRIWSAACSTGQEPYSIAMTLKDNAKFSSLSFKIEATDINQTVLNKASNGIYSQFEVQRGVPTMMLMKYFAQDKETEEWLIDKSIRESVKYTSLNLVSDMVPMNSYDIIFCRNVLIYFDMETKMQVLKKMHSSLTNKGILVLGSAEHVNGGTDGMFEKFGACAGIYIKQ